MAKINWAGNQIDVSSTNPNIGITREFLRTDDGTTIGQKHSITIKGYFLAQGDPLAASRQADLYQKMLELFGKGTADASIQAGLLEINPEAIGTVNTLTQVIRYNDAKLLSVSLPEPPDETAGIQIQEYQLSFEASQPKDNIYDAYKISSVSETWNIKKSTEFAIFDTNDKIEADTWKYPYEIEHTLSATGMKKFESGETAGAVKNEAWYEAWNYVNDRLANLNEDIAEDATINQNTYLENSPSTYEIGTWKPSDGSSNVADSLSQYTSFNRVRSSAIDIVAGSYSVTTTFLMAIDTYCFEINCGFNQDDSGAISMTVEGTISGLTELDVKSNVNDKLLQSKAGYDAISSGGWGENSSGRKLANKVFTRYYNANGKCAGTLQLDKYPRSITVTENKNTGTIQFNVMYKAISSAAFNLKDTFPGAISATLNVSDDNRSDFASIQTIAIIPIIGRAAGPVIQDMGTTKERARSASIEIIFHESCKKPDNNPAATAIAELNKYKPGAAGAYNNPAMDLCYVQDAKSEWDWVAGRYQGSITWIYQEY
jgi:hypothetical protein